VSASPPSSPDAIRLAGWPLPDGVWNDMTSAERAFAESELAGKRSRDFYRRRVAALGFIGRERVLDLGCGLGQWSVALAEVNGSVLGVDPNKRRLTTARALRDATGIDNLDLSAAWAESLPVADGVFDLVFCYGVFMFTDMPRCLREIRRVTRPGARIYLNANTWGWYAHLLLDRGILRGDWSMARTAARMVGRAFTGATSQVLARRRRLEADARAAGLRVVAIGPEGSLSFGGSEPPEPAYPRRFYGMTSILELVAERPAD